MHCALPFCSFGRRRNPLPSRRRSRWGWWNSSGRGPWNHPPALRLRPHRWRRPRLPIRPPRRRRSPNRSRQPSQRLLRSRGSARKKNRRLPRHPPLLLPSGLRSRSKRQRPRSLPAQEEAWARPQVLRTWLEEWASTTPRLWISLPESSLGNYRNILRAPGDYTWRGRSL